MPDTSLDERRWTRGSYAAAGLALFILLYNLTTSILSMNRPSDGWLFSGDMLSEPPSVIFNVHFIDDPTRLKEGDRLLKVNGQTLEQTLQAQHEFYKLEPPNWPDGTLLQYEVLRDGEPLTLDVPIRRISTRQYYAEYLLVSSNSGLIMFLTGIFFFAIGVLVFLLRPSNRAAHALLLIGVGFLPIVGNGSIPAGFYPDPPISIPFDNWTLAINASLIYLVLAFPHPKLPLRRFPRLSVLLIYLSWPVAFNLAYLLNLDDWKGYIAVAMAIYPVQIILVMLVTLIALIHTAVTVRDPVGRSQLKWMVIGISGFVFLGIGGWMVSAYLFPETMENGNWLTTALGWFLMPICLAVAITRYRLFDIDLIIRRTLIYSILIGMLGLIYLGGVTILQTLLTTVTGQSSPISIVLSTLAIAAIFNPLHKRIKGFIDKRFYRRKYNTDQVLAAFASMVRSETDLEALTGELVHIVEQTVHPEHASLWLVKPREQKAYIDEDQQVRLPLAENGLRG